MQKLKVGILFGGQSTEHEVSRTSATSIVKYINKDKYELFLIGIDKEGNWLKYTGKYENIDSKNWLEYTQKINDLMGFLKSLDVAFPVLHGLYGEDGTVQGLFELAKLPYVGCRVLSSSISMDKAYTKIIFDKSGLQQLPYEYIYKKNNGNYVLIDKNFDEVIGIKNIISIIDNRIGYPCFVKPSNSGSSVGIKKVKKREELEDCIEFAAQYDKKIVIEKGINCREIESAVLGNDDVRVSVLGEILPAGEFYSYDSKYTDQKSRTIIPADIDTIAEKKIKEMAIKAFKAVDGKGLSRVDFFIDKETNEIYINEINTMPGFTNISMYPKLWESTDLSYEKLIDTLISLALQPQG